MAGLGRVAVSTILRSWFPATTGAAADWAAIPVVEGAVATQHSFWRPLAITAGSANVPVTLMDAHLKYIYSADQIMTTDASLKGLFRFIHIFI